MLRRLFEPVVVLIYAWTTRVGEMFSTALGTENSSAQEKFMADRQVMTEEIAAQGVRDPHVLAAIRDVPRHLFVSRTSQRQAYADRPLSIGHDQTISQPYIVALMTQLARPSPSDRALEVGIGSGYQAAVLSRLVSHVYGVEIVAPLARAAEKRLKELGYGNVTVRVGDGYTGWPDSAPFDIIMVAAAPDHVPAPLLAQLKAGGRLVIPVGPSTPYQELQLIEKDSAGQKTKMTVVERVRFVPLVRPR